MQLCASCTHFWRLGWPWRAARVVTVFLNLCGTVSLDMVVGPVDMQLWDYAARECALDASDYAVLKGASVSDGWMRDNASLSLSRRQAPSPGRQDGPDQALSPCRSSC